MVDVGLAVETSVTFPGWSARVERKGMPILGNMGWDEEAHIEPMIESIIESMMETNDPVRRQLPCPADVTGRTQRLTFSRTIDADATATMNERDGDLNVTVNVLNVEIRPETWPGADQKDCGSAPRHYWMDSLPCLSNRRESR